MDLEGIESLIILLHGIGEFTHSRLIARMKFIHRLECADYSPGRTGAVGDRGKRVKYHRVINITCQMSFAHSHSFQGIDHTDYPDDGQLEEC